MSYEQEFGNFTLQMNVNHRQRRRSSNEKIGNTHGLVNFAWKKKIKFHLGCVTQRINQIIQHKFDYIWKKKFLPSISCATQFPLSTRPPQILLYLIHPNNYFLIFLFDSLGIVLSDSFDFKKFISNFLFHLLSSKIILTQTFLGLFAVALKWL